MHTDVLDTSPGVEWRRIYWQAGQPKGSRFHAEVNDPPCSGYQGALCLKIEKTIRIFCPYSLQEYVVTDQSQEYATSEHLSINPQFLIDLILKRWKLQRKVGMPFDARVVSFFIKHLGGEPPHEQPVEELYHALQPHIGTAPNPGQFSGKGGKAMASKLLKKVDGKKKTGETLLYFLGADSTIAEACEKFATTRSNILSRLFLLNKDNGIGYSIQGERVVLQLPVDAAELFV